MTEPIFKGEKLRDDSSGRRLFRRIFASKKEYINPPPPKQQLPTAYPPVIPPTFQYTPSIEDNSLPIPVEEDTIQERDCRECRAFAIQATNLCSNCRKLCLPYCILCSESHSSAQTYFLGSVQHVLAQSASCPFCFMVAQVISRNWLMAGFHGDLSVVDQDCFVFEAANVKPPLGGKYICIMIPSEPEIVSITRSQIWEPMLRAYPRQINDTSLAPPVKESVDWDWLRRWLRKCASNHSGVCLQEYMEQDVETFRVIDVQRRCVMKAPRDCTYVTLSYVWGSPQYRKLVLTKANLHRLERMGALSEQVLPATLEDAIHVCIAIGQRYLWIDSLCIVQDDIEIKRREVSRMGEIFSRSYVCIVAAGGDNANAGLPGVYSRLRDTEQHRMLVQDIEIAEVLPNFAGVVDRSTWNTRGWTFQERLLSRRRIFFTNVQVYFQCQRVLCHEDSAVDGGAGNLAASATTGALFRTENFSLDPFSNYKERVEEYSKRTLSNQSDILDAFSGISSTLYSPYTELFFFGLPQSSFDAALLWTPDAADGPFRQRFSADDLVLPSWSWISHQGQIKFDPEPLSGSLVDWYATVDESGQLSQLQVTKPRINDERFSIYVSDFYNPERYHTRIRFDTEEEASHLSKTDPRRARFSGYDAYSEDLDAYRNFPAQAVELAKQPGRLLLRAESTLFKLSRYSVFDRGGSKNHVSAITIIDRQDAYVGIIDMDDTWISLYLYPDNESAEEEFQFIALSASQIPEHWPAYFANLRASTNTASQNSHNKTNQARRFSHFYYDGSRGAALNTLPVVNVMLLEWQEGVARRVGLGKVFLAAWKDARPVLQTIVLE